MKKTLLLFTFFFIFFNFLNSQIILDGNMNESAWGSPIGVSADGPPPGFGTGHEINALYATALSSGNIYLAIAGNVQVNNHILLFIDSKEGGFNSGNFGRSGARKGVDVFNSGTTFDTNFFPDYCLLIGTNAIHNNFYFDLYTLSGNLNNGGGPNNFLGDVSDPDLGANPGNKTIFQGFELKLSTSLDGVGTDLQYAGGDIKLMAMYISDAGSLSNQFISTAKSVESNYGVGPITFSIASPDPVSFNPNRILPVNFVSLAGHIIQDKSFVEWAVTDDVEIDHYELEESNNGSVFQILAVITARQTHTTSNYTAEDAHLFIGNNFYRVKAIGLNGKMIYSKIIRMPYGRIDNMLFVYPNPVKNILQVQLHGLLKGKYKLHIYNDAGQEIYKRNINHDGSDKTLTLQLPPNLETGIYRLLFIDKYQFYKQNFLVE